MEVAYAEQVKEDLTTAILLSKAARRKHRIHLKSIGEVQIDSNYSALVDGNGEHRQITYQTLDTCLEQVLHKIHAET